MMLEESAKLFFTNQLLSAEILYHDPLLMQAIFYWYCFLATRMD